MKRKNNLYYSICKLDHIRYVYENIIYKNTKNKRKIVNFDSYYVFNICYIKHILSHELYVPGHYNIFAICEPKRRVIMSQSIYDKLVNHLVSYYILKPVIEPCLIDQNIATRENMGTDYGIKLFKKYLNKVKLEHKNFYILKFDISKYFYNINHDVLKSLLVRKIKDKKALKILFDIIDSTDCEYVNSSIEKLLRDDSNVASYFYKSGRGLPIGNMTSQILAIFYLNDLDHYIKEELKIKYYIRYMDDGLLIHHDKNYLKHCLAVIKDKIENEFKLKLNNKTKIYSIKEGIEFLGFRFYIKNEKLLVKVKTQTKKRFKKKLKLYRHTNFQKYKHIVGSYKGHLQYANTKSLFYRNVKDAFNMFR